jgi:hypothetical protein
MGIGKLFDRADLVILNVVKDLLDQNGQDSSLRSDLLLGVKGQM